MKIVEAVLFSTDRPVRVGEIAELAGLKSEDVSKAMRRILKEYTVRDGAIEVVRIGNKYVMQLREDYVTYGYSMGKKDMSDDLLHTLAIIAYYQPVTKRKLRDMLGTKIYPQVDELKKRGFVYGKKSGRTEMLQTTKRFSEYFGINASHREDVRKFFEAKIGGEEND